MTTNFTPERIQELRDVVNDAHSGPWEVYDRGIGFEIHVGGVELNSCLRETFNKWDAVFIATFDPPTVSALLDELETLRNRAEKAEGTLARVRADLSEIQARGRRLREQPNNGSVRHTERAGRADGYIEAASVALDTLDGGHRG